MPAPLFVIGSMVMACTARVVRAPRAGESVRADALKVEAGGKGFNVAVAARRLGLAIDGLFAVGDDAFGLLAAQAFAAYGLPSSALLMLPGSTGAGVGLIDRDGENRIAVHPGANDALDAAHAEAAAARIAAARFVTAQFEVGDAVIAAAFAIARAAGAVTLLNPSPFRPIAATILHRTDILVVNAGEAAALAVDLGIDWGDGGATGEAALARALFACGISRLIVTRGAAGATLLDRRGARRHQPGFIVATTDTVGAGDAFVAGWMRALASGEDDAAALRWAAAAGALATTRFGVLDALPDMAALRGLLQGSREA